MKYIAGLSLFQSKVRLRSRRREARCCCVACDAGARDSSMSRFTSFSRAGNLVSGSRNRGRSSPLLTIVNHETYQEIVRSSIEVIVKLKIIKINKN